MAADTRDTAAAGHLFRSSESAAGKVYDLGNGRQLSHLRASEQGAGAAQNAGDERAAPASTITGAKGEFTLVQLEPGQYRLQGVRNGFLETCCGARRAGSKGTAGGPLAQRHTATGDAGSHLSPGFARLSRSPQNRSHRRRPLHRGGHHPASRPYRLNVQAEGPPGLGLRMELHERPRLGDEVSINLPAQCQHGICEFTAVPSGSYEVTASASLRDRRGTLHELYNIREYRARVPVEVVDAGVEGVRVVVNAGAEIAGRITIADEDQPSFTGVWVLFQSAEGDGYLASLASESVFTCPLSQG